MSAPPAPAPRRIAVLDVGKTNVKVVMVDTSSGAEAWSRTMPNLVRQDGPYPHVDVARIAAFFTDALADLVRQGGFEAVAVTAHGASGALLKGGGLALPVLDYEYAGPDSVAEAYHRVRPAFAESFSPRLPGGLNLGAQLFWQAQAFPDAFAATTAIVTYPQFWAHWLTGVAATEATSLGAHTDLWAPRAGRLSAMVEALGWAPRMAPLRSAFDVLGPIRADLEARIGLAGPVPVACGLHDSNASLLPHLQDADGPLTVLSTGTWAILFAVGGTLEGLDPARDTLANVDAYGRPVPSARFMGGREFDLLTAPGAVSPDPATVAAVLAQGIMALPSFSPGNGPFPRHRGRWSQPPDTLTAAERTAAASLYEALLAATGLALLSARGPTVVEGPFARNALFCDALRVLSGREVRAAPGRTGTGAGAARLFHPPGRRVAPPAPPVPAAATPALAGLAAYAEAWHRAIAAAGAAG